MNTMETSDAGNGITVNPYSGSWTFENISDSFDEHVRDSVPGYDLSHEIICLLSDFFISYKSRYVDIGCSTGTLTRKIYDRHHQKFPEVIGLDSVETMVDKCQHSLDSRFITYKLSNIITDALPKECDMFTSIYTLQFIAPKYRQAVFDKIYHSLNWGGAFFLFEKVRAPDARFQDIISQAYINYKLKKFSAIEIISKSNSLTGVMEPFTSNANLGFLARAGFTDICTIAKFLCFEGILAIK